VLCEFLKVSIKVFSQLLFSDKQGMCLMDNWHINLINLLINYLLLLSIHDI
jgi:hypothetical protein